MKSRGWREARAGPWHSEDGVHLGVPPARHGSRTPSSASASSSSSGGPALARSRSTEDVSPRCRRTQFRLVSLAPAAPVRRISSPQGDRAAFDSSAAAGPAAATAEATDGIPAALPDGSAAGGPQTAWHGTAEQRRTWFQRRVARWESDSADRQPGVQNRHPADVRQDASDATNCLRLDAKGGSEHCGECAPRSVLHNGVASDRGGNTSVDVHLQSWSERFNRHSEIIVHPRSGEMDSSTARHHHCVDESIRLQHRSPLAAAAANGDGRHFAVEADPVGSEDPVGQNPEPVPSPPTTPPTTPPTPTGDWIPTFVVSDYSGPTWPEPWSELLRGGGGGGGGGRRLSAVSDCSTVSSIGWDRSRRGSLLDLDTEGLQVESDGRLERADRSEGTELQRRTESERGRSQAAAEEGNAETFQKVSESRDIWLEPARQQRSEETSRKISSWSYSSVSTLSQDGEEELLATTPTNSAPASTKSSQWRKVKGVVQWTPFVQTYKKRKYLWVQLAGHQGNFRAGADGTIQKRLCGLEQQCLQHLMTDCLRPFVPEYRGQTESEDGQQFLQLQDLLAGFVEPCVMDCKIGVRTYLEEELAKAKENPKLRKDMYEKMLAVDRTAPTEEEHRLKAVTKPRYMVWRETISSTASLGFRIEGIRKSHGYSSKDFKTTRSEDQIKAAISMFTDGYPNVMPLYLERLKEIMASLESSEFFKNHEFIGSSLLFVHDANRASVWLIDFAKTTPLPADISISHRAPWRPGSHEDGYLTGAENLQRVLTEMAAAAAAAV